MFRTTTDPELPSPLTPPSDDPDAPAFEINTGDLSVSPFLIRFVLTDFSIIIRSNLTGHGYEAQMVGIGGGDYAVC